MVKRISFVVVVVALLFGCGSARDGSVAVTGSPTPAGSIVRLPEPTRSGSMSLEEAIARRRSVRAFTNQPLTQKQIGQLLWAAQGITDPAGLRAAPSAGALYPMEIYLATVDGTFHYDPNSHSLIPTSQDDRRTEIFQAALQQSAVRDAPALFVITAVYARTEQKYGKARGKRYVHMEAGHIAQNILLESVALGLGAVPIGAFTDSDVAAALMLPDDQQPLYLIPVGHPGN